MSRNTLWLLRLAAPLAGATVLTQIAYPLVHDRARDAVTVLAVLLFFAASVSHAALTRGPRAAVVLVVVSAGGGLLVEAVGTHTGLPFGRYDYTDGLGPSLLGVPVVIPLAWAMMAWPAYLAAARLTANLTSLTSHSSRIARTSRPARTARIALAGWALASWDLFLDPQMVDAGHWRWEHPEPGLPGVGGVPLTNYLGWIVVAVVLMAVLDLALRGPNSHQQRRERRDDQDYPNSPDDQDDHPDALPLGLYLWTYLSSVLAHVAFFGLPGSAAWGAVGMGAVAVPLARSLRPAVGVRT